MEIRGCPADVPASPAACPRIVTTRLADAFSSCFGEPLLSDAVRKGREQIAFSCGRLLYTLHLITGAVSPDNVKSLFEWRRLAAVISEDVELVRTIIDERPELRIRNWRQLPTVRWLLYLFPWQVRNNFDSSQLNEFFSQFPVDYDQQPSLDLPTFTNYLCCVCSLFGDVDLRTVAQVDKSDFCDALMTHFFQVVPADFWLTARILRLTVTLNKKLVLHTRRPARAGESRPLIEAMLAFAPVFPASTIGSILSSQRQVSQKWVSVTYETSTPTRLFIDTFPRSTHGNFAPYIWPSNMFTNNRSTTATTRLPCGMVRLPSPLTDFCKSWSAASRCPPTRPSNPSPSSCAHSLHPRMSPSLPICCLPMAPPCHGS
ncbi:hypothetical protein C8R46DRAFT_1135640 [Mycena filopes]|nr:hypothetical protein C8R46DRAFT_1135640 [Mycena filopes]